MGKQIIHILSFCNSNLNYIDENTGLTAIMKCIVSRNVTALKILLSCSNSINLNTKAGKGDFEGMTSLHLCVLTKEIELLDEIYHYNGEITLEMDTLNYNGETAIDLADNMKDKDHQSKREYDEIEAMYQRLKRYRAVRPIDLSEERYKRNEILEK